MGLLNALLDAVFGGDNRIAGQVVSKLTAPLSSTETATLNIETTEGFGVQDETGVTPANALLLIDGELVQANARTINTFTTLTRGINSTKVKTHGAGTLVFDLSRNTSALDLVRRGFFLRSALDTDLDVIGRNHGLTRCPGLTDNQWRALISIMAYLPAQTILAFTQVLDSYLGAVNYSLYQERILRPNRVFVRINVALRTSLRGAFYLNGGTPALTTGLLTVDTPNPINHVLGVYADKPRTRAGERSGETNFFLPGGSFLGSTITLDSSPGGIGTSVIVDYGAFTGHYLALNETERYPDDGDFMPYLSDPFVTARCLLDQVRAAGVFVELSIL